MVKRLLLPLKWIGFVVLVVFYLYVSKYEIYKDVINPDGINWHNRTMSFIDSIKMKKYEGTFQAYHPGITLMWISSIPLRNYYESDLSSDMSKYSFLERDYLAKMSLVIFSTFIFAITFLVLWKMVNYKFALIFSLIFTLEPFVLGMRRLYHLDYLMTILVFLSFLFLIYANYKSYKWWLFVLSGLFFALGVLTKSAAIIVLPAFPFIILLGNSSVLKKLLSVIIFIVAVALSVYAFFPAIWNDPLKSFYGYYQKVSIGVSDIGVDGRKEVGTSGKSENVILDETVRKRDDNFYITSLFARTSVVGSVLIVVSVGFFIYVLLKGVFIFISSSIKNKSIQKVFNYEVDSWLSFWSLGLAIAILVALTLATKKTDRYAVFAFPFILIVITYFLYKLNKWVGLVVMVVYLVFTSKQLYDIKPYFFAYSNPYLGGLTTRLYGLEGEPFGIGSYEAFQIIKKDMEDNNYNGFYTVAGSKSIKAISTGGKFSRYPSCVTDYVVVFTMDFSPKSSCRQKYTKIGTVKIGGLDYWTVYRRVNQKHQSNYK